MLIREPQQLVVLNQSFKIRFIDMKINYTLHKKTNKYSQANKYYLEAFSTALFAHCLWECPSCNISSTFAFMKRTLKWGSDCKWCEINGAISDRFQFFANLPFNVIPFLGAVREEGLKNFFTVVTLRVFSLVFFSSNLEKGPIEACPGRGCGAVDWEWDCVCATWLLAYAASSSRCSLVPGTFESVNTSNQ